MVRSDIGALGKMEYPGRYILLQVEPGKEVAVYGITVRSSKERLILKDPNANRLHVVLTEKGKKDLRDTVTEKLQKKYEDSVDEKIIDEEYKKQEDLLVYDAILWNDDVIAVSNGKQTNTLINEAQSSKLKEPSMSLTSAMIKWDYEPDGPHYTPRILGIMGYGKAYLGIIGRNKEGFSSKLGFIVGGGSGISTYAGKNMPTGVALPSYNLEPFPISLKGSAAEIANDVCNGVTKEFWVSVAAIVRYKGTNEVDICRVNRKEG